MIKGAKEVYPELFINNNAGYKNQKCRFSILTRKIHMNLNA